MSDQGQKRGDSARKRRAQPTGLRAWVSAALGTFVLVSGGFLLGIVVGVVSEEPDLVATHVLGQSEQLAWEEPAPAGDAAAALLVASGEEPAWAQEPSPSGSVLSVPAVVPSVLALPAISAPPAGWVIQVGAFSRSNPAEALVESLTSKGFETYLAPSASDGRWRVRVGPLATQSDAQRVARRLEREESLSTWVLSEGGR